MMKFIAEIVGLIFFVGMVVACPYEYTWAMMGFAAINCFIYSRCKNE